MTEDSILEKYSQYLNLICVLFEVVLATVVVEVFEIVTHHSGSKC